MIVTRRAAIATDLAYYRAILEQGLRPDLRVQAEVWLRAARILCPDCGVNAPCAFHLRLPQ